MKITILPLLAAGTAFALLPVPAKAQNGGLKAAVMPLSCTGLAQSDADFMTERLMIELQRSGGLEVMERSRRDELLREGEFQQSGACDAISCLVEAGRLLAVRKIVGGSIGQIGQVISVQARLVDLKTGALERTAVRDYTGGPDVLLTRGMREVALELAGKLGNQPRDSVRTAAVAAPGPKQAPTKFVRERPASSLKAPRLTYGALALTAGFGTLGLVSLLQAESYDQKGNGEQADSYRGKGKAALAAASGCAAACLVSALLKTKPAAKDRR